MFDTLFTLFHRLSRLLYANITMLEIKSIHGGRAADTALKRLKAVNQVNAGRCNGDLIVSGF